MAGKNHIERSFRILIDDSGGTARDLSADLVPGTVNGGGFNFDQVDMTGVSNSVYQAMAGYSNSEITAQFHMNDTATTGATTVLNGVVGTGVTVTLQWGQSGAAPTTGDPEWEGEYLLLTAGVVNSGGRFVHDCRLVPEAGQTAPAWGTVS